MRPMRRIRSFLLAGLLAVCLLANHSWAVSISLVPDGPTTIEVGESLAIDIFMNLDQSDKDVGGIDGMSFQVLADFSLVNIVGDPTGSIYGATQIVTPVPSMNLVAFSAFGNAFVGDSGLLGSMILTGLAPGSFEIETRRTGDPRTPFSRLPHFTHTWEGVNRFDFDSDDTLPIAVICGADVCAAPSPDPVDPVPPEPPPVPSIVPTNEPPPAPVIPEVDVGAAPSPEPVDPGLPDPPPVPSVVPANEPPLAPVNPEVDVGRAGSTEGSVPPSSSGHGGISINFNLGDGFNLEDLQFGNNGSTLNSADSAIVLSAAPVSAVVPEPSTGLLLGVALAGLALLRWRPKNQRHLLDTKDR